MKKTLLVVGASRGIGAEVARFFDSRGDQVIGVSRNPAVAGEWIEADISTGEGIRKVIEAVGDRLIDALLFMGGVWEQGAFSPEYDFRSSPHQETAFVVNVNLVAPIELTKSLATNLKETANPRAIYMGSLSGLDHSASPEVANTASKFGLRGAIEALRLSLRDDGIGFTVINPGNVATEEVLDDISSGRTPMQVPIPLTDIVQTIEWILNVSKDTEIGDVNLIQKTGRKIRR